MFKKLVTKKIELQRINFSLTLFFVIDKLSNSLKRVQYFVKNEVILFFTLYYTIDFKVNI